MVDMREYKGDIRRAVKRERDCDENWAWRVRAIRQGEAKIGWGYLDYMGEKKDFTVSAGDSDDFGRVVIGTVPDGHKVIWFVGDKPWDDCPTMEGAVSGVIHSMAQYAHAVY